MELMVAMTGLMAVFPFVLMVLSAMVLWRLFKYLGIVIKKEQK